MSINHFSSDQLPEPIWWAQQPQYNHHQFRNMETPTKSSSGGTTTTASSASFWGNSGLHNHSGNPALSSFNFDLNNEDDEETVDEQKGRVVVVKPEEGKEIPKEPLFEKPLTPSDVGKLNRLVIPKQHAEKYFPLNGGGNDSGEKGLLLRFEDELGKPWRFRYSYWNSSQSYVLTKGWSRFVKEKRLDAGDIVLFERHRLDGDRLFIGWRRRSAAATVQQESGTGVAPAVGGWTRVYFSSGHNNPYPVGGAEHQGHHNRHGHGPGFPYQPDCLHAHAAGAVMQQQQQKQTTANSKTLRLFGVNLECQQQPEEAEADAVVEDSDQAATPPEGSSTSGQPAYYQFQYYPKVHHAYFNHQNHMNINFSRDRDRDTNQTRYPQG